MVQRITRELPGIALRIVEGHSVHLLEWLQRGDIDATFLYGTSSDYHLRGEDLLNEDIVLISAPNSLNGHGDTIDFKEAARLPLALPGEPFGLRRIFEKLSQETGCDITPTYEVDSFWTIKSLVEAGVCHSLMPLSSVQQALSNRTIEARKITPSLKRQVVLAMPNNRSNTRATDAVIALLKDEVTAMINCGEWPAVPLY